MPTVLKLTPLRDGGGKASPGRVPPRKRIGPYASPLGRFIKRKALPLVSDFAVSTAAGAKQHPGAASGRAFQLSLCRHLSERDMCHEETRLGMVIGPCTRSEAAAHCRCKEEDLCPCPMAGIDESDKIRSIFDGSKGGANLRIQQNRVEKTTARTVTVCNQCLRWLRASRSRGNPGALGPEPLEPDDSNDKPPGHAECHGHPPDTMCFSDNRDASTGSGRPWNFPGPTEEWVLLKSLLL